MTEQEWLACTDPEAVLVFLGGKFLHENACERKRKLRLFTCACCRRIWHLLTDDRSRNAVEVAERYADGLASEDESNSAASAADQAWRDFERNHPDRDDFGERADNCGRWAAYYTNFPYWGSREALTAAVWEKAQQGIDHRVAKVDEEAQQCVVLRDIFGNPFRPVSLDPAWQKPPILALVKSIYNYRTFDRLPHLADVLENAGCTDAALLGHCRGPGPHVRGCWAVDAVLGKK